MEGTERELQIMVDNGCTVLDVVVEHAVYGQLTGQLRIRSRYDVAQFMERLILDGAKPLSSLTDGIHLHTLLCPDEAAYRRSRDALRQAGFLLE
jgi:transcriptional regulator of NAD metabolism